MDNSNIEAFDYGITREWRHNKQLVIITTEGNMLPEAVDTWLYLIQESFQTGSPDFPILILLDISHPNQTITPYCLKQATAAYNNIPIDRDIFGAIYSPDPFLTRILDLFIQNLHRGKARIHYRFFSEQAEALKWLEEHLPTSDD